MMKIVMKASNARFCYSLYFLAPRKLLKKQVISVTDEIYTINDKENSASIYSEERKFFYLSYEHLPNFFVFSPL